MLKIAYSDRFVLDLPEGHRFPMIKYELVKEQLIHEGLIVQDQIVDPGLIKNDIILLTHDKEYLDKLEQGTVSPREMRKIGFPYSPRLIKRSKSSSAGTLYATQRALKYNVGMNIAGGTHHAYKEHGEAFCLLNDIAICTNYLLHNQLKKRIAVVDLDVHQGNGTAKIFENSDNVFTISVHGASNYPLHKEKSNLDIALPVKTNGMDYLKELEKVFYALDEFEPDFIFFQAGVDVLESDKLGSLALDKSHCKQRDQLVIDYCHSNEIPLVVTMGGGYSKRVADIVDAHCNTFKTVIDTYGF